MGLADSNPSNRQSMTWTKVPLIGCPGSECGRVLLEGGKTEIQQDFKDEFGPCDEPGRWIVGMMFVCQKHAVLVAREFGDDIDEIEAAWREECL